MLVYIIDGFNLIHKISNLEGSSRPHLELIYYIRNNKLTGSKNNRVLIFFDGGPNLDAVRARGNFEIFFSHGQSADDLIKEKLSKFKKTSEVIVVSDDREIRDAAKKFGAKICRTADFLKTKKKQIAREDVKDISYALQHEITEELRKIWLKDE